MGSRQTFRNIVTRSSHERSQEHHNQQVLELRAPPQTRGDRQQVEEVVATNDKQRFSFSPDGRLIRANQGHSVEVDLGLVPVEPPELLYHGTVERFLDSVREKGLLRGKRHHVHLSADRETAARVGQRRGRPVVLVVEAGRMRREGNPFFQSENGVWLTHMVPPTYLQFPREA